MRLIEKFRRFMYGRYGNDRLNRFLLFCVLFIMLLGAFFRVFSLYIGIWILIGIRWVLLLMMLYRFLSKNIYRRRAEEQAFLRLKKRIFGFPSLRKAKRRDRKTHIYKRCPGCKEMLRLPKRKGDHTVKCCRCGHRFDVHVR